MMSNNSNIEGICKILDHKPTELYGFINMAENHDISTLR